MSKIFILYDGRAKSMDTDDATVIVTASSEEECKSYEDIKHDFDGIWFEYDLVYNKAINETARWDL